MERHARGQLIPPDELEGGRLWSGLQSGQYGLRLIDAVAYPSHLAAETRNYGSRASNILIPVTDEMREADEQAKTRKADEQADQQHAQAQRELVVARAEHEASTKRALEAEAAVSKLEQEKEAA